nr:leucine-rich repeat-containing protein 4C-like isoform X1 [Lytechinus pictus]
MGGQDRSSITTYLHQVLFISVVCYSVVFAQTPPPTEPPSCPSGCQCNFQTRVVDCQRGGFTSIPTTFPSYTRTLLLSGNILRNILEDSFVGLSNLVSLDLSSCEIRTISPRAFNGLDNLHTLNLQLNHMDTLPSGAFAGLTNLRELYLQRNQLQILPGDMFNDTIFLSELDIGNNRITQIHANAFSDLSVLWVLNLAYNQLDSIPEMALKNLTNLKHLALSGNPISTIPPMTFSSLTYLNILYLDSLQLESLEFDSFFGLQSVTNIDLSYNQLQTLDPSTFQLLTALKTLLLAGNSWNCECSLLPLVQWLKQSTINYYSPLWYCTNPNELRGMVVYGLEQHDFACEPTITNPPIDTTVGYRNRVFFQCVARGDPTPEIQWYQPDGTRITATSNEENMYTAVNGIVLVIQFADKEHVGSFNCTATNVHGSDSVKFQVDVTGLPEPEVTTIPGSTASDGSSTTVEASISTCLSYTLSIMVESVDETSIAVSWVPFTGEREITGYVVQSHLFGDEQTNSYFVNKTEDNYELTNLISNTGYTVCASFLIDHCPLVVPRRQCREVTTAGVNPTIAAMQRRHRQEIIGTVLACILGTLLLMATIFFVLWRYRKPKTYNQYDFKGNKDTAAFAGIPEDAEGFASGSVTPNKYEVQNGAYINGGLDMSMGTSNDYSKEPIGARMSNDNTVIQHSVDVHSDVEPTAGYHSDNIASYENVTTDATTVSLKSTNSVVSDDGSRDTREPKDKASKVKKSQASLSSDEGVEKDGEIEMTDLRDAPHSNGDINMANEDTELVWKEIVVLPTDLSITTSYVD